MRRGKIISKGSQLLLVQALMILIVVLLSPITFAQDVPQDADTDGDRVLDSYDACLSTNFEEGLPIITHNKEFLGCSCSQIYDKIGEYCYDVFCSTNRPFSMKERTYSSREMNCAADYCINNSLYDFPDNKVINCVAGKEEKFNCTATIIESSELCKNGSIAQFVPLEKAVVTILDDGSLLDDYEKLQKRAYELSQNSEIKIGLGISGENIFLAQSEKTMNSIIIEKNLKTEIKMVSNTEKTISTKTIKIIPSKHKTFKKLYVFEELPRGSKVEFREIITGIEIVAKDENSPVILVWEIEKVSKPIEITYQVNKPLVGDSNTLLIAKEVKSGFWKLMILPVIFIIIVVWVFIRSSQRAIPKRKRIFKE